MKTTKYIILGLVFASTVLLGSCKKCTVAETDTDTGQIVEGVIIYPQIGYLTQTLGNYYHINGDSEYADAFLVSFDDGITKQAVDWENYDILANPMSVSCKASFVREVVFNYGTSNVFYNVVANSCESCDPERYVENYVMVPKVPTGFTVYFDTEIKYN